MKKIILFISLFTFSQLTLAATISPYTATYRVKAFGFTLGRAKRTLSLDNQGRYDLFVTNQSNNVLLKLKASQHSQGLLKNTRPSDYEYHYKRKNTVRDTVIHFNWSKNIATSQYKGYIYHLPLHTDTQDPLSYQLNMRQQLLKNPNQKEFIYSVANNKKVEIYHFVVAGEKTLKTDLGIIKTLKIIKKDDSNKRSTTFWLAPKYEYILVKLVHVEHGTKTTLYIENLKKS